MQETLLDPSNFLSSIFSALVEKGITVSDFSLDHICYRTETLDAYIDIKRKIETLATCLVESEINDRLIATYKLHKPFKYNERKIDVIEISSPKKESYYRSGYEHVEFVIDQPFEAFMAQYPNLSFDLKGVHKVINPDIRLRLGKYSVKFHHKSLEEVIIIEKQMASK